VTCQQHKIRGHRQIILSAKLPSWEHNWNSSTHVPSAEHSVAVQPTSTGTGSLVLKFAKQYI
jgi:hypothetical protein